MNWHQLIDDATSYTSHWVRLGRLLGDIHTFHHDMLSIDPTLHHAAFALVLTGQDDYFIVFTNFVHYDSLQHFWRKRNNFHEPLSAQFARDWPENTGANRLELGIQQHSCVTIELNQGAVLTTNTLGSTNHYCVIDLAFFDATTWRSNLYSHLDDIANTCVTALGTTQYLDAHDFFGTSIVGYFEPAFSLNHSILFPNLSRSIRLMRACGQSWSRQPPCQAALLGVDVFRNLLFEVFFQRSLHRSCKTL